MKERSYTVRVHTHPETWGNEKFLASRILASKLLPDATHVSYPVHSRTFCAPSLPSRPARAPIFRSDMYGEPSFRVFVFA